MLISELTAILWGPRCRGVSISSMNPVLQTPTASELKEHAIVEAESQLWHSRQKHLELDGAHDLAQQDTAIGIDLGMHTWA